MALTFFVSVAVLAQAIRFFDGNFWSITGRLAPYRYKVSGISRKLPGILSCSGAAQAARCFPVKCVKPDGSRRTAYVFRRAVEANLQPFHAATHSVRVAKNYVAIGAID